VILSVPLQLEEVGSPVLTVKLAKRYIIRSVRCLIGDAVSPDDDDVGLWEVLGVFTAPLEVGGFDGRWVMGLVPWVHAFWGGFLWKSASQHCFRRVRRDMLGVGQCDIQELGSRFEGAVL
jgi:hypothetical protein